MYFSLERGIEHRLYIISIRTKITFLSNAIDRYKEVNQMFYEITNTILQNTHTYIFTSESDKSAIVGITPVTGFNMIS